MADFADLMAQFEADIETVEAKVQSSETTATTTTATPTPTPTTTSSDDPAQQSTNTDTDTKTQTKVKTAIAAISKPPTKPVAVISRAPQPAPAAAPHPAAQPAAAQPQSHVPLRHGAAYGPAASIPSYSNIHSHAAVPYSNVQNPYMSYDPLAANLPGGATSTTGARGAAVHHPHGSTNGHDANTSATGAHQQNDNAKGKGKQGKKKGKKDRRYLRAAAGDVWYDPSLSEWPESKYQCVCVCVYMPLVVV
jgi:hypothetical protein